LKHKLLHIKELITKAPLLLGAFVFFISCENDIKQVMELSAKQDSAIVSASNVEITYSTDGNTVVLMKAPELLRYIENEKKSYFEFPKGMHMFFYDDFGKVSSTLKANYSIYYEDEGRWVAKYDVVSVNKKGEKLNTEYLVWLRDEEKITTDQFVKITMADGSIIYGDGFESNQTFSSWEVVNGRGILNIKDTETN